MESCLYFVEGNNGPFWMTLAQQAEMNYDRQLGTAKTRNNKTKIELLKDLRQSGYVHYAKKQMKVLMNNKYEL